MSVQGLKEHQEVAQQALERDLEVSINMCAYYNTCLCVCVCAHYTGTCPYASINVFVNGVHSNTLLPIACLTT